MSRNKVPEPTVMPLNRQEWAKQIGLSNFINVYYIYKDIQSIGACSKILIVGPGLGLDKIVLAWRGYEVTTLDIDGTFTPDYIGSVHDLNIFGSEQFDIVIASHVLEHLAEPYLNSAVKEIARVGKYALIYLPVHGKHLQWRFMTGSRKIDLSFILDLYNYFRKPDGTSPCYMAGQHFWEVGMRGFKVRELKKRFSEFFHVFDVYRNKDWLPSINFVLKSRAHGGSRANDK
ncbi:MAG: class I SAM-dependent methyltransferase [Desulfobacteraceae bacterium]|nr:MAG: class I SAM-dependent methyltransferase [Desulfobacteraceae bacterium]